MNEDTINSLRAEPIGRTSPFCSWFAIALTLFGAFIGQVIIFSAPPGDASWGHIIIGPLVQPTTAFCGVVLSVISIIRRERPQIVTLIAIILNLIFLYYGMTG